MKGGGDDKKVKQIHITPDQDKEKNTPNQEKNTFDIIEIMNIDKINSLNQFILNNTFSNEYIFNLLNVIFSTYNNQLLIFYDLMKKNKKINNDIIIKFREEKCKLPKEGIYDMDLATNYKDTSNLQINNENAIIENNRIKITNDIFSYYDYYE